MSDLRPTDSGSHTLNRRNLLTTAAASVAGGSLSDDDIRALVAYLRTLGVR